MVRHAWFTGILWLASRSALLGQPDRLTPDDSIRLGRGAREVPLAKQRDILDMARRLLPFLPLKNEADTIQLPIGRTFAWILPEAGYSLQTRLLIELQGNIAYRKPGANVSSIVPAVAYSQNHQLFLATRLNSWSRNNRFNWIGDYRLYKYPQETFGLGTSTTIQDQRQINFTYLRFYQTVLKRISKSTYVGLGYQLDYHWNIRTLTPAGDPSSIPGYQTGTQGRSISSGVVVNMLYDGRLNSQNPEPASYASVVFRANGRALGSDANYQSLLVDLRKYVYFPAQSAGILACWAYNAFTFGGAAPYLDLPSTGNDMYENSGRGYIQGRFRGRTFLYQEIEYRFPLTRNRLLGAVVFVNNQIVSESITNRLGPLAPATGAGLRLTTNKYSRLNLAIDYGLGLHGSQGFFFNFGEFF